MDLLELPDQCAQFTVRAAMVIQPVFGVSMESMDSIVTRGSDTLTGSLLPGR